MKHNKEYGTSEDNTLKSGGNCLSFVFLKQLFQNKSAANLKVRKAKGIQLRKWIQVKISALS